MSFDFQISQNRKRVKNRIRALNPNAFENYIASVFEKLGYSVLQTPLTNDGGKDIIASLNGHTYYIECKHFTEGSVGREIIQKLVGAGVLDGGVDGYVLATTSYYNDNALKCLEKASVPLVLLDLDDLAYLEELAEKESDKDILSFALKPSDEPLADLDNNNECETQAVLESNDDVELSLESSIPYTRELGGEKEYLYSGIQGLYINLSKAGISFIENSKVILGSFAEVIDGNLVIFQQIAIPISLSCYYVLFKCKYNRSNKEFYPMPRSQALDRHSFNEDRIIRLVKELLLKEMRDKNLLRGYL